MLFLLIYFVLPSTQTNVVNTKHIYSQSVSREPAYKKPVFESQPVLFLIQWYYFHEQPEMFLNLIDKKLFDNRYFYCSLLAIMQFSILLCYGEILHLRKWILRERDTEHFWKNLS